MTNNKLLDQAMNENDHLRTVLKKIAYEGPFYAIEKDENYTGWDSSITFCPCCERREYARFILSKLIKRNELK